MNAEPKTSVKYPIRIMQLESEINRMKIAILISTYETRRKPELDIQNDKAQTIREEPTIDPRLCDTEQQEYMQERIVNTCHNTCSM